MATVAVPGEMNFKDAKPEEALKFIEVDLPEPVRMTAEASTDFRGNSSWAGGEFEISKMYLHDCTQENGSAPGPKPIEQAIAAAKRIDPAAGGVRVLAEKGALSIAMPGKSGGNFSFSLR